MSSKKKPTTPSAPRIKLAYNPLADRVFTVALNNVDALFDECFGSLGAPQVEAIAGHHVVHDAVTCRYRGEYLQQVTFPAYRQAISEAFDFAIARLRSRRTREDGRKMFIQLLAFNAMLVWSPMALDVVQLNAKISAARTAGGSWWARRRTTSLWLTPTGRQVSRQVMWQHAGLDAA